LKFQWEISNERSAVDNFTELIQIHVYISTTLAVVENLGKNVVNSLLELED
jgi:hypothetical protein